MFPSLKSNADTPSDRQQPSSFAGSRHPTTNQSCASSWWPLGSKDSISDGSRVNQVSRPAMEGGRQGDLECPGMSWSLPSAAWSHPSSCDIYCSGLYVSDTKFWHPGTPRTLRDQPRPVQYPWERSHTPASHPGPGELQFSATGERGPQGCSGTSESLNHNPT